MQKFFATPVAQAAGAITDATPITQVLLNGLNFLLSVAGIVGIIGMVVAGILYLTAAGDEGRIKLGKQAFLGSVMGLVIVMGALVITEGLARLVE